MKEEIKEVQQPWKCRLGFHKWGKWKTYSECLTNPAQEQVCYCMICGRGKIATNKPKIKLL